MARPFVLLFAALVAKTILTKPSSSHVSRYPVTLPPLDIRRAMNEDDASQVDSYLNNPDSLEVRRLMAGVRFRLAYLLLYSFGLASLHETTRFESVFQEFRGNFLDMKQAVAVNGKFVNDVASMLAIGQCICLYMKAPGVLQGDSVTLGMDILLGVEEETGWLRDRRYSLMVFEGKTLSRPLMILDLKSLLEAKPRYADDREVYLAKHFEDKGLCDKNSCVSPLEAAYVFALAFQFRKGLALGDESIRFESCCDVEGSRLFSGQDTSQPFEGLTEFYEIRSTLLESEREGGLRLSRHVLSRRRQQAGHDRGGRRQQGRRDCKEDRRIGRVDRRVGRQGVGTVWSRIRRWSSARAVLYQISGHPRGNRSGPR